MKSSVLILGIVLAVFVVGGAFAYTFVDEIADLSDDGDSGTFHKIANKVDKITSSDSSSSSSSSDGGSDIVSEIVKFNHQNGEGQFREVTYKDGGFRQYDKSSGKLIGSSYDEDQEELGVVDGNLE
ncbi:hypothetical protein [Methanobrevibacter olleyae]|uniref:Uncharacterized protein n=1 Tax=Methanobrevibacter olleyae TaxID=294671 RepID=A0A126R1G4_METOL|nr:hypothetical protein [Methanobrevibacter olleyae]AMK15908.1 hypothetical protein YLM1_1351 [Methanobrevibacter olleyae]SFL15194.1 hypothetical protein SAMN02910297_00028 [Methanobrevibacter olleyae]